MILLCNYEQCSHMSYQNTIAVCDTSEAEHSVIKCATLIKINNVQKSEASSILWYSRGCGYLANSELANW